MTNRKMIGSSSENIWLIAARTSASTKYVLFALTYVQRMCMGDWPFVIVYKCALVDVVILNE